MHPKRFVLLSASGVLMLLFTTASYLAGAATTNVNIENFDFFPASVTINAGDSVQWNWISGTHSTTSSSGLWDSTELSSPANYTQTFPSQGTFPYFCTVHGSALMSGSVTVSSGSQSLTLGITSPTNGAIFAAPWSGSLVAIITNSAAPIQKVEFFRNGVSIGSTNNPPYTRPVSSLGAGNYAFTAVATDNLGASNTSPAVAVSIVAASPIILSGGRRLSPTQFEFSYNTDPGFSYVVQRATNLTDFSTIMTNMATGNSIGVLDNSAGRGPTFYRVGRLPNPQ